MNQLFTHIIYTEDSNGRTIEESNIVHIHGINNEQYQIDYNDLDDAQKKKVDDFVNLIISMTP